MEADGIRRPKEKAPDLQDQILVLMLGWGLGEEKSNRTLPCLPWSEGTEQSSILT